MGHCRYVALRARLVRGSGAPAGRLVAGPGLQRDNRNADIRVTKCKASLNGAGKPGQAMKDVHPLQYAWLGSVITLQVAVAFAWLSAVAIARQALGPRR